MHPMRAPRARPRAFLLLAALVVAPAATLLGQGDAGWKWRPSEEAEIARREKKADTVTAIGSTWFHVSGKSYEVHTAVSPRFTAEVSEHLDVFREHVEHIFSSPILADRRPVAYVYEDHATFLGKATAMKIPGARAFFDSRHEKGNHFTELALYAFVNGDRERDFAQFPRSVLQHELTHGILQEHVGGRFIPEWFNEGLACYFELWDIRHGVDENLRRRLEHHSHCQHLADYLDKGLIPSLPGLMALSSVKAFVVPAAMGPQTYAHYAASEALFLFLMKDAAGRTIVTKLYEEVLAGRDPAKIFERDSMNKLDAEWHSFMTKKMPSVPYLPTESAPPAAGGKAKTPGPEPADGSRGADPTAPDPGGMSEPPEGEDPWSGQNPGGG